MMMLFHPLCKGSPLDGGPPYQAPLTALASLRSEGDTFPSDC